MFRDVHHSCAGICHAQALTLRFATTRGTRWLLFSFGPNRDWTIAR